MSKVPHYFLIKQTRFELYVYSAPVMDRCAIFSNLFSDEVFLDDPMNLVGSQPNADHKNSFPIQGVCLGR
jgi:hypothetical protein